MSTSTVRNLSASAAALLLGLAACSGGGGGGTTTTPQTGTINGRVTANSANVTGAVVARTGGVQATTGADGRYSFTNLAPGAYTVTVTPPTGFTLGTETAAKQATVTAGGTATVDWAIAQAGGGGTQQDIQVLGAAFNPSEVTVATGTTVRWINNLNTPHTITPDVPGQAGAWTSQNIDGAGTTFSVTMNTAGTFNYHCNIHAGMTGRVTVQ